jgi:hypothetical protein
MSSSFKTLSPAVFIGLLFAASPCLLYAGEKPAPPEPKTELEAFLSKIGILLDGEFAESQGDGRSRTCTPKRPMKPARL